MQPFDPINQQAVNKDPAKAKVHMEIDDHFVFNVPLTQEALDTCLKVQTECASLAHLVADATPEGKEQTIAINNILAVALWAVQAITRRQVIITPACTSPQAILMEGQPTPEQAAAGFRAASDAT